MSQTDPQTDIRPGDELVAYLDGELPPEECRRIEERLAADAAYRRQLHELDQAWEALDALPKPAAHDNFARTTIEMVSLAAQRDVSEQSAKTSAVHRRRYWGWAVAGIAAGLVAFAAARWLLPNSNDELLAELPLIQQFDVLSQIDDVEFLRLLPTVASNEQLNDDAATMQREVDDMKAAAAPDLATRRQWVESLTPDKLATLEAQMMRFHDLAKNPGEQQRLRDLEREIRQSDDADELRGRLVAYGRWLARQLPGDQEELRILPTEERLQVVREIVEEEQERASRRLSADDKAKLRGEIMEIYHRRKDDFLRYAQRRDPDNRPRFDGPEPRRALTVLMWELRNDDRDDETRDQLIAQLSPEAQAQWDRISRRDHRWRNIQLWRWIRDSLQPTWSPGELERFFADDLDNNQRAQLLGMPADEMQAQLERLYLASQFGVSDPDELQRDLSRRGGLAPGVARSGEPRRDEHSRDNHDRRGNSERENRSRRGNDER